MGKKANEERGEHELTLAGKAYVLRPSITALKAIERETGEPLLGLVRRGNTGSLTLDQLGIVAAELIRAGAAADDSLTRAVDSDRIAELIFEEGQTPVQSVLTLCLLDAVMGGRSASGEAKAAPAKTAGKPAGAASRA